MLTQSFALMLPRKGHRIFLPASVGWWPLSVGYPPTTITKSAMLFLPLQRFHDLPRAMSGPSNPVSPPRDLCMHGVHDRTSMSSAIAHSPGPMVLWKAVSSALDRWPHVVNDTHLGAVDVYTRQEGSAHQRPHCMGPVSRAAGVWDTVMGRTADHPHGAASCFLRPVQCGHSFQCIARHHSARSHPPGPWARGTKYRAL